MFKVEYFNELLRTEKVKTFNSYKQAKEFAELKHGIIC